MSEPERRPLRWVHAIAFGVAFAVFGSAVALGASALWPSTVFTPQNVPALQPIAWVFWAVWLVIYPSMGVATYLVWRRREFEDVGLSLLLCGATIVQGLTFWLSDSARMTAVIDGTGVMLAVVLAFAYGRHTRAAALWLSPLLLWMPTTLAIKLWLWTHGIG